MPEAVDPIDRSLMDDAVGAADDFYRHVNGGWLDANPVPAEYPQWGAFHQLNEQNQQLLRRLLEAAAADPGPADGPARMVGDYFAAGMDEAAIAAAGIEPLRPLLARIDEARTAADILAVARDLQHVAGDPLHAIGVSADFEDSTAYLVYLGQGGLGLPEREYYLGDDERSVALRAAYVAHVAAQLRNLGQGEDDAASAAEAILAFERRLAEASLTPEQQRDPQVILNRFEVARLDELMPAPGLAAHLRELGASAPTVCVDNPGFFTALGSALGDTPVEVLRQYLRWHLVKALASSLPAAFEDEAFAFYDRTLGGQQEQRPRWKRILDAAARDIGEQVAQLYVAEAFPPQSKARCEQLVDHLLHAMDRAIRGASWMTDATRAEALAKLAGFTYKIGYPDAWRDYSSLAIGRDSFVGNRMRATAFEYDRQFGRLHEPVDKGEWEMPAHVVNAYYHPLHNEIVFPAGILQPPFFYADADDAVNYGAIGVVIGHEITHGFDDTGSRFDAVGSLRDWWTEADRAEFERRAEVIVEQFNALEAVEGVTVNGRLTLGENIADLGGLTIAWDALHEALPADPPPVGGFTAEERFFIAFAVMWRTNTTEEYARLLARIDSHSPARHRVNAPLANFPPFAATFGVPDGSPMARVADLRAHIW